MRNLKLIFTILIFTLLVIGATAQTQGDLLRQETKLDQVYQMYNLSGKDVIVAMIERGIDYTHPDYMDDNGYSKIAYIFDMIDQTGASAPGNTYGVGTIYDRTQINQALDTGPALATNDRHGHGTASTGIAAGDGSGATGAPYRGVAHGATIISVKMIQDPFPAGNGQPAQAGYYNPADIPIALQFVKDKSIELGLPVVALMNFGSIGGPTDGTSEICQAMDNFTGPGRLLVCGVGDDGGADNFASLTVAQGNTEEFEIAKGEAGNLRFEAWYDGDDRLDVTIIDAGGTPVGPYTSPASNNNSDQQFTTGINYYHNGADRDFSKATNGKRQIMIDFSGATGTYKVQLTGSTVSNGKVDASLNPALFYNTNKFLTHVVPGSSINDFASAINAIVPTDYVYSNSYTDIDGTVRTRNEGAPGEIWTGSSAGPTLDGRIGVDVAVPGELNFGAYSPNTFYSRFRHLMIQGGNGLYGLQNAVSGAAPVLTGMIALMLEVNPNLTVQEAKTILRQTAISDAFTGTTPNGTWGHGKLNALAAIEETQKTVGLELASFTDLGVHIYPNPATEHLFYELEGKGDESTSLELMDLNGRVLNRSSLKKGKGKLELPEVGTGMYIVKVRIGDRIGYKRLIIQ